MPSIERARRLIAEEHARRTGSLNLGNLGLTELPVELCQLTHLRSLNLGVGYGGDEADQDDDEQGSVEGGTKNQLQSLPAAIGALRQLTMLSVAGNLLTDLSALQHLPTLQTLDCAGTKIGDLTALQYVPGLQALCCADKTVADLAPLRSTPR